MMMVSSALTTLLSMSPFDINRRQTQALNDEHR
jgi:hypothetical protein